MSGPRKERPRLGGHVAPRLQLVGAELRVVLHDLRTGRALVLGEREWQVLRCADGTRDLAGIRAAIGWLLPSQGEDHLAAFFEQLQTEGLLDDELGEAEAELTTSTVSIEALEAERARYGPRRLDPLPGYRLDCDGQGTCCATAPTVIFAPGEALRARALCPELLGAADGEERLFAPERGGGVEAARRARAVTLVDGRCAFLDESWSCRLHRLGGVDWKPAGCRLFPRVFVDDGEAIRVSVVPECACVFRSARSPGGEALIDETATVGAHLPASAFVRSLPESIEITPSLRTPRGDYVAWSRRQLGALGPERDAPEALWAMARALEAKGLEAPASVEALSGAPALDAEELAPWLRALSGFATRWADRRAVLGLAGIPLWTAEGLSTACERLLAPTRALEEAAPSTRLDEHLYWRAVLHGHQLVDGLPLTLALRDRAIRLLVSRAFVATEPLELALRPGALEHPIALVESLLRSHGLSRYVEEV